MTTATLEKNSTDSVNEQSEKSFDKPDDTFPSLAVCLIIWLMRIIVPDSVLLLWSG